MLALVETHLCTKKIRPGEIIRVCPGQNTLQVAQKRLHLTSKHHNVVTQISRNSIKERSPIDIAISSGEGSRPKKRKLCFPLTSPVVSEVDTPLLSTFRTVSVLSVGDLLRIQEAELLLCGSHK